MEGGKEKGRREKGSKGREWEEGKHRENNLEGKEEGERVRKGEFCNRRKKKKNWCLRVQQFL